MKMDLVMWTKNSQKTLVPCLKSIDRVIPKEAVNRKIIVDGHSTDKTEEIAKKFNWEFHKAERTGISYQANQALGLVETELFASFEHDIVLHPDWFTRMISHFDDPEVAVAQGVRVCVNPTIKKIEEYFLVRPLPYSSLDNTVYRTKILKSTGGFSSERYPMSPNKPVQERVRKNGYKWIVDRDIVSDHLKDSIRGYAKKIKFDLTNCRYVRDNTKFSKSLSILAFSPVRGLQIAVTKHCPEAFVVYPYLRLQSVISYHNCS